MPRSDQAVPLVVMLSSLAYGVGADRLRTFISVAPPSVGPALATLAVITFPSTGIKG
jgi:hypothetical protein